MKRWSRWGMLLLMVALKPGIGVAQERAEAKPIAAPAEVVQLKVQVVFAEYEGEKKIKSLPYILNVVTASEQNDGRYTTKVRIGDRVPVATGDDKGTVQFQYIDVGTSIDCRATVLPGGRYRLSMNLDRSWVQSNTDLRDVSAAAAPDSGNPAERQFHQPTIRQFRTDTNVVLRDGQTIETNFATDPVSGKVVRLEVTATTVK